MHIESIRIKNFKSLQNVTIKQIPQLAVFVGRNGTGKSTLFRTFAFLKNCLQDNVRVALNKEGGRLGFREVVSRGHEQESIEFEIQFYLELNKRKRLVTYVLEIGQDEDSSRSVIKREILRYKRGQFGAPYHYLDFSMGRGEVVTNEDEFDEESKPLTREAKVLDSPDVLAIKGIGFFGEQFRAASAFRKLIENWHISDFHIRDARGKKDDEDAIHLSSSGDNLPAVARYLMEDKPDIFDRIKQKMRERVPGVTSIEVKPTEDGGLLMKYADEAFREPFIDKNVSDGTIKMFAYLVLLEDPKPFPVLCVEEPENQLYPELMTVLADEFDAYAQRGGQVFVSSHSPEFLNAAPLDSIFWIEKDAGTSKVYRANDFDLIRSLFEAGDPPGILWNQGQFNSVRLMAGK